MGSLDGSLDALDLREDSSRRWAYDRIKEFSSGSVSKPLVYALCPHSRFFSGPSLWIDAAKKFSIQFFAFLSSSVSYWVPSGDLLRAASSPQVYSTKRT